MARPALVAAAASLGTLVLVTAAGGALRPSAPAPPRAGAPATQASSSVAAVADAPSVGTPDDATIRAEAAQLEQVWLADDPTGTAPEIALRFLQALQRHDDVAALRETLASWTVNDPWQLHRVMNDVRRHAQLEGAGPCRRALPFTTEVVVVACGTRRVLVQATAAYGLAGVALWDRPRNPGAYRYPHTWAITTVEL